MDISSYMEKLSDLMGCRYELFGKPLATEKVFAADGLLPAFSKKADSLSSFVLNKPLGANYQKVAGGINGLKVTFDDSIPSSYRILIFLDVLIEVIQNSQRSDGVTRLDELLYE